ncbi:MAG TPA: hypothetical protein PLP73_02930, partial [Candidatus Absconditabacterales bacterium]|nr:hypothetical protein [Candidatus Absconditabacterales bacterium]
GAVMKIFLSGGGLRVVRIENEKEDKLLGYGEYPTLSGALFHCEIDIKEGHISYEEQYSGQNSKYDHYITGAFPNFDDKLDSHIYNTGESLRVIFNKNIGFLCREYRSSKIFGCATTPLKAIEKYIANLN